MAVPGIVVAKAAKEVILHPKRTAKIVATIIISLFLIIFLPFAFITDALSSNFFIKGSTSTEIYETQKYDEVVDVYKIYREQMSNKLYDKATNITEAESISILVIAPDIHYALAYYTVNSFYDENYIFNPQGLLDFLNNITRYSNTKTKLENGTYLWEFSSRPLPEEDIIKMFTTNAKWQETYRTSLTFLKKEVEQLDFTNTSIGNMATALAMTKVGYPYSQNVNLRMTTHYDCSSLVYRIYKGLGLNLPVTAASQGKYLVDNNKVVSEKQLLPGDLIFYSYASNGRYKNISHVAIYAGDGMMVEAANERQGVIYTKFRKTNVNLYGRPY